MSLSATAAPRPPRAPRHLGLDHAALGRGQHGPRPRHGLQAPVQGHLRGVDREAGEQLSHGHDVLLLLSGAR